MSQSSSVPIDVVVRCKNEMPYARRVFEALRDPRFRVHVFDSGSTDGSREQAEAFGYRITDIEPTQYVPGRVLNEAMRVTSSQVVAFVNADAIPLTPDAVDLLVEACMQGAAASYGKQVPRPDALPDTRHDYARAFPDDPRGPGFKHFFSMAASAIRRSVWERLPFDSSLRYSEDIDWTWRLRALGQRIAYVPEARFEHSHDYPLPALRRRMRGEGQADALIYHLPPPALRRDMVRPLIGSLLRDVRSGLAQPSVWNRRLVAQVGRFEGRARGVVAARVKSASSRVAVWNPNMRLTAGGEPEAERVVRQALQTAVDVTRKHAAGRYQALLLIGGYASGEGAVEIIEAKPRIHNDVDLVLVVSTDAAARHMRSVCERISAEASEKVGAAIDLYPASVRELRDGKGKLIWVDAAVRGALLLDGDRTVLGPLRYLGPRCVDSDELGRLLVNRATGIALSRLAFERGQAEQRRAARHVAKMWLALGDALLIDVVRYRGGYKQRLVDLGALLPIGSAEVEQIHRGYRQAVGFRADPSRVEVSSKQLEDELPPMWKSFSFLEAHRLGVRPWVDVFGYADDPMEKFPHKRDIPPMARKFAGVRAALKGTVPWHKALRHPRELLARVAPTLAFATSLSRARQFVAPWLGGAADPQAVTRALEALREVGS